MTVFARRLAMWANAADPRHGTENGYGNLRCRCERCRRAHADYYRVGTAQGHIVRYRQRLVAAGFRSSGPAQGRRKRAYVARPNARGARTQKTQKGGQE